MGPPALVRFAALGLVLAALAVPVRERAWADATPQEAQMAAQVIAGINQQRVSFGLKPLRTANELMQAAQYWSEFMRDSTDTRNAWFRHTFSAADINDEAAAGRDIAAKQARFGYSSNGWGENLVAEVASDPDPVSEAIADWMNSPSHRANILHAGYTDTGVGVALRGPFVLITQEFGSRAPGPPPPPPVPTLFRASATGKGQIALTWSASGANLTGFRLERKKAGKPDTTYVQVGPALASSPSARAYTDGGLKHGVRYVYRLRSLNGSATSSAVFANAVAK